MAEQSEIVEQRRSRTVIRRRVIKTEELDVVAPVEQEALPPVEDVPAIAVAEPVVEAQSGQPVAAPVTQVPDSEASSSPASSAESVVSAPAPVEVKPRVKSSGLPIAEPEVKKPIILGMIDLSKTRGGTSQTAQATTVGVAGATATTQEEEEKKLLFKKVVKKRSREEGDLDLGLDGIGRIGNLGQLTRLTSAPSVELGPDEPVERVFRPSGLRKKRVVGKKGLKKTLITTPSAAKRTIKMGETIAVAELAKTMGVKATFVLQKLTGLGVEVKAHESIDADTASLVAGDFNFEIKKVVFDERAVLGLPDKTQETEKSGSPRPPVVTVMGHVDHGKTSLLDAIRKANVAAGEAGGITQHIGAYSVALPKGKMTFLDTPGHEAFTAMRSRGASVTDIVILVVAADEGARPQTIESIRHAQAAGVPIVVAINKMDKLEADPDRVKRELSDHGLVPEEWGGDTMMIPVSAHNKTGIQECLEAVLLQAEVLELRASAEGRAEGVVIEAKLDKGRGPVATVLIKSGTLRRGDWIIAGTAGGKVRAMTDYQGKVSDAAGPSDAVEILGLDQVPSPGDSVVAVKDDKDAKTVIAHREQEARKKAEQGSQKVTLETLLAERKEGEVHELKIIVKADVQGSLEAIKEVIGKLATPEVKISMINDGVGAITESDVTLASASNAVILGFNARPETKAMRLAEQEKVEVKLYRIIYELVDDLKLAMKGLLAPKSKEVYHGRAEVRQTFTVSKIGLVAGCLVVDGKLSRNSKVRLLRDNVVVADVYISTLKRFKDDAREVTKGLECGVGLEGYTDIKEGDVLEAYAIEDIKP